MRFRTQTPVRSVLVVASLASALGILSPDLFGQPIRPLAADPVILAESQDPENSPLFTPSILRTSSGRLAASYTVGGEGRKDIEGYAFIQTSDDGGKTWVQRASTKINQGRLFEAGGSLSCLASKGICGLFAPPTTEPPGPNSLF